MSRFKKIALIAMTLTGVTITTMLIAKKVKEIKKIEC